MIIAVSLHLFACIWFALGSTSELSWVATYEGELLATSGGQYAQCMHWVLTQVGFSSTVFYAQTKSEYRKGAWRRVTCRASTPRT